MTMIFKKAASIKRKLREFAGSFQKDEKGSFTIAMAVTATVITVSALTMIDISKMAQIKSSMQNSVDSALIAALKKGVEVKKLNPNDPRLDALVRQEFEVFYSTNVSNAIGNPQYAINSGDYVLSYDAQNNVVDAKVNYRYEGMVAKTFLASNRDIFVTGRSELTEAPINFIIDIVMCIDATGSMQHTLNAVQAHARTFNSELRQDLGLDDSNNNVKIRVKPYFYRDYTDIVKMKTVGFIDLDPNKDTGRTKAGQNQALAAFLSSERAAGGADYPEAAGACLNNALKADWMTKDSAAAQQYFADSGNGNADIINIPVIVFWTDAPISSLVRTRWGFNDPTIPSTYSAFEAKWNNSANIRQDTKLLIQFGPHIAEGWQQIRSWDRSTYGGSLATGNSQSIKVIANEIKKGIPSAMRISS